MEAVEISKTGEKESLESKAISQEVNTTLNNIINNVKDSKTRINKIAEAMKGQGTLMDSFHKSAEVIKTNSREILTSVEEQSSYASQIVNTMSEMAQNTDKNVKSVEDLTQLSDGLKQESASLDHIIVEFKLKE